ncbi:bifunctional diguanylate cyclase/phosphodiesterase [Pseudoalteromonas piscicida]|uniref:putative bifunctional diguanylate cyclase/phosphodiesterase n=1 Tax=Pseudoalteromonas piscicida TaxID=43662 RepID=UPI0030ABA867
MIALLLVLAGSFIMGLAFSPAIKTCRLTSSVGWRVLLILMAMFELGYLSFAYFLFEHIDSVSIIEQGLSLILFLGSIFVFVVNCLSLSSLRELNEIATQAKYNAEHDFLTDLENRQRCIDAINERKQQQLDFSVILVDLNNFKQINDAKGHFFGDKFLIELANRMRGALLPQSQLYRMGGDEFIIIMDVIDVNCIYSQNNALLSELKSGIEIEELQLDVTYSAGASLWTKQRQLDVFELLKQADIAMYSAKHSRQSIVIFDEELHEGIEAEFQLLTRLKAALARGELTLYYQPIICSKSGDIHGVEALLRWPQADGSMIMPEQFIELAERNNLIRQLSAFVINRVFQDLAILIEVNPRLEVHINLSCQDFVEQNLINTLAMLIDSHRVDPTHIVFELTESTVMQEVKKARSLIETLIDMGFSVSIDDFGTGFSSFSILKELPISQIKIDGSFVSLSHESEKDQAIVETSMFLARKLNCSIVAEGVESDACLQYLNSLNCPFVQGFQICEPLSLSECIKWMSSQSMVKGAMKRLDGK